METSLTHSLIPKTTFLLKTFEEDVSDDEPCFPPNEYEKLFRRAISVSREKEKQKVNTAFQSVLKEMYNVENGLCVFRRKIAPNKGHFCSRPVVEGLVYCHIHRKNVKDMENRKRRGFKNNLKPERVALKLEDKFKKRNSIDFSKPRKILCDPVFQRGLETLNVNSGNSLSVSNLQSDVENINLEEEIKID